MLRQVAEMLGFHKKEEEENGLALATAALLVQVSVADGEFSTDERIVLKECLKTHFNLDADGAESLLERAERDHRDVTCLFSFTRVIAKELDNEARQGIVRLLWKVALADNSLDNFEENVVAKVAGLLGVSSADRVRLKKEVEAT